MIADDPQLDVRLPDYAGPQPRPIVLVGRSRPSPRQQDPPASTAAGCGPEIGRQRGRAGGIAGTRWAPRARPMHSRPSADEGYLDILVEGGAGLATALWQAGWWTGGSSIWAEESPAAGGWASLTDLEDPGRLDRSGYCRRRETGFGLAGGLGCAASERPSGTSRNGH